MITLHPLPWTQVDRVAHLILTEPQYPAVGQITEMTAEQDRLTDFHCALRGTTYVGYFKIDRDFSRIVTRLPQGATGFRGLVIGGQYQGVGYGRALLSALPDYLRQTYPALNDIWLSIAKYNTHGIAVYEKAGWVVDGPDRDGRTGPEQVMRLALQPR